MKAKYWVVRPNPSGILRITEFLQNEILAVGWLSEHNYEGKSDRNLYNLLEQNDPLAKEQAHNLQVGMIRRFVEEIKVGDVAMVPTVERIFVARVIGEYFYNETKVDEGYPHQRSVEWLTETGLPRHKLKTETRRAFRPQLAIYSLDRYLDEVQELMKLISPEEDNDPVDAPASETKQQENIGDELVEEAYRSLKEALDSDDPDLRFRAIKLILDRKK